MATVTFQYRSTKDKAPLEARLSYTDESGKRVSRYARTRINVNRDFWDEYKQGINFRDAIKSNIKKDLTDDTYLLQEFILNELKNVNEATIPKDWLSDVVSQYYAPPEVTNEIPTDLLGYWQYYLDLRGHELKSKPRSYQKWVTVMNKIDRFQRSIGKRYQIKDVNEEFKSDFVDYCVKLDYSNATTIKEFAYIKTVCVHAKSKKIGTSPELDTLKVRLKKPTIPKVYLSLDEIEAIAAVQGLPDHLDNARDWLIISCYTGQRVSDFMRFDKSMIRKSKGRLFIDIKQVKTGKDVTIPLLPEVVRIMDKHGGNFPRPISTQKYNDYIKEVSKQAGLAKKTRGGVRIKDRKVIGDYYKWELVTSHIGRRSFATNYYGIIPTSILKNITGHGTEQMLLVYIGKSSKDTAVEAYDLLMKTYQ